MDSVNPWLLRLKSAGLGIDDLEPPVQANGVSTQSSEVVRGGVNCKGFMAVGVSYPSSDAGVRSTAPWP